MSNIIVEEGYPADFHLGFSMIIWVVFISIMLIFGTFFLIKAYKTNLLNQKELYIGNGMVMYGMGSTFIFIQVAVLFPALFIILFSAASMSLLGFNMFFIYYFEKNLVNLKKIPTIYSVIIFIFALLNFFYVIINRTFIFEFFGTLNVFLTMIGYFYVFILIVVFIKRTIGVLRTTGYIWISSLVLLYTGGFLDHPPVVTLLPEVFALITAIIFIIGGILWFYSNKRLCDGIIAYYNQTQICTIHRGKITKDTHIYYCPNCSTNYCEKCYEQVIKKEGCWNCQEGVKTEDEDKWEREAISKIEVGKGFKKKQPK